MKKKFILIFLAILFFALIIMSTLKYIRWHSDTNNINKNIQTIHNAVEVIEVKDNQKTEIIQQDKVKVDDPYKDYIKMNLIDVDFRKLKDINTNTVGWIQVNGTNINYPFTQANDNSYYLNHSFDHSKNKGGWVFLDYRNSKTILDKNTIIYGHSRLNSTMFGTLKTILSNGWLQDANNYIIKMATEYDTSLWQVFSVYRIPTTSDYLQTEFRDNDEFLKFANKLLNRSSYDFRTKVSKEDKILTLSTCYDNYSRVVLHAKMIKRELK